jgi:hypothetical protein
MPAQSEAAFDDLLVRPSPDFVVQRAVLCLHGVRYETERERAGDGQSYVFPGK